MAALLLKIPKKQGDAAEQCSGGTGTGQLTSEGAKQLEENSELSPSRYHRWLNQEAVGEANPGFWNERKEEQVESQQAVWRGFYTLAQWL